MIIIIIISFLLFSLSKFFVIFLNFALNQRILIFMIFEWKSLFMFMRSNSWDSRKMMYWKVFASMSKILILILYFSNSLISLSSHVFNCFVKKKESCFEIFFVSFFVQKSQYIESFRFHVIYLLWFVSFYLVCLRIQIWLSRQTKTRKWYY